MIYSSKDVIYAFCDEYLLDTIVLSRSIFFVYIDIVYIFHLLSLIIHFKHLILFRNLTLKVILQTIHLNIKPPNFPYPWPVVLHLIEDCYCAILGP